MDSTATPMDDDRERTHAGDRAGRATAPPTSCASREIARPEIADNEVLVRVHAAGLDRGTWHLMTGSRTCCGWPSGSAGRRTRCRASTSPARSSRSARR